MNKSVTGASYNINSYSMSQLDFVVLSVKRGTVPCSGRDETAAATVQNEQSLVVPYQLSKNTSKPTCSDSRNLKPPVPLYPRTLGHYTNVVLLLLL